MSWIALSDQDQIYRFHGDSTTLNIMNRAFTNDSAVPPIGDGSDMYSANPIRYNDGRRELKIPLTDDSGVYRDILDYTNKHDYSNGQHVGVDWLYSGSPLPFGMAPICALS